MMPPVQTLIEEYWQAVRSDDTMATAQTAFAVALRVEADRPGDDLARVFAVVSLAAAERAPSATLDDVSSLRSSIGGISIPEYFHDGVVRWRLAHLLPGDRRGGCDAP